MARDAQRQFFLDLLDEHGAALMSTLRRLSANPHDAEDLFQETAVKVWRSAPQRSRLRSPRGWLMTIAFRCFLDHRGRHPSPVELGDVPDEALPNPSQQAQRGEQCRELEAAVAGLPGPIRAVVALHYTGGLTLRQTAKAMGISVGTAKSRLNNALERLRKVLS